MVTFSVMTWNVENLFQAQDEDGPNTVEQYQQKLDNLVTVIQQLDPDIIALQEIGNPAALRDLSNLLQDAYPHSQLSTNPDRRGIRVGYLSKLEIQHPQEIINFPPTGLPSVPGVNDQGEFTNVTRLGRGALQITVEPAPGQPLHLINAHLKSKFLSFPRPNGGSRFQPVNEDQRAQIAGIALLKRTAEAIALCIRANQLLAGNNQPLILLGDMNDVADAATTQILHGPPGSEIGTRGFNPPDQGDDTRLFNLAPLIPAERRFSRIHRGNRELIDHIFASVDLFPGNPRQTPTVDSHVDILNGLPSVTNNPTRRRGEPVSDHAPITATFDL